jgi:hypothetical protein
MEVADIVVSRRQVLVLSDIAIGLKKICNTSMFEH